MAATLPNVSNPITFQHRMNKQQIKSQEHSYGSKTKAYDVFFSGRKDNVEKEFHPENCSCPLVVLDQDPGNLYVKGFHVKIQPPALCKIFGVYGEIAKCRVWIDGLCFVRFKHHEDAQKAIRGLHGRKPPGAVRHLIVKFAHRRIKRCQQKNIAEAKKIVNKNNVFVRRVPRTWQDKQLRAMFAKFGTIHCIKIMNGIAFVRFVEPRDADQAIKEMNGVKIEGITKPIEVRLATSDPLKPKYVRESQYDVVSNHEIKLVDSKAPTQKITKESTFVDDATTEMSSNVSESEGSDSQRYSAKSFIGGTFSDVEQKASSSVVTTRSLQAMLPPGATVVIPVVSNPPQRAVGPKTSKSRAQKDNSEKDEEKQASEVEEDPDVLPVSDGKGGIIRIPVIPTSQKLGDNAENKELVYDPVVEAVADCLPQAPPGFVGPYLVPVVHHAGKSGEQGLMVPVSQQAPIIGPLPGCQTGNQVASANGWNGLQSGFSVFTASTMMMPNTQQHQNPYWMQQLKIAPQYQQQAEYHQDRSACFMYQPGFQAGYGQPGQFQMAPMQYAPIRTGFYSTA